MNELFKVNYDSDCTMLSASDLYDHLNAYDDFKVFFIEVMKLKILFYREELNQLREVIKMFAFKFGVNAVVYLSDSVTTEMALPCKSIKIEKRK